MVLKYPQTLPERTPETWEIWVQALRPGVLQRNNTILKPLVAAEIHQLQVSLLSCQ